MTNWLTAAGLALFAGGLATLICFRAVLFGGGGRRARRGRRAAEASRRAAGAPETPRRTEGALKVSRRTSGASEASRRTAGASEPSGRTSGASETPRRMGRLSRRDVGEPATVEPARRARRRSLEPSDGPIAGRGATIDPDEGDHGGLASIGFADYEDEIVEPVGEIEYLDDDPDPPTVLDRSPRRVGHRAEGWVRPQYHDVQPAVAGDYWTPPPSEPDEEGFRDREPSARGYGWPVQVERLPPVPAYEPATGFDRQPVPSEPTEVVPAWAAGDERADRLHLPRSWPARDDKPRRRPRPRPRPAASVDGNGVYVSRHAADPPR